MLMLLTIEQYISILMNYQMNFIVVILIELCLVRQLTNEYIIVSINITTKQMMPLFKAQLKDVIFDIRYSIFNITLHI